MCSCMFVFQTQKVTTPSTVKASLAATHTSVRPPFSAFPALILSSISMEYSEAVEKGLFRTNKPLSVLEAQGRRVACQLIRGLATAPALDPASPYILVLVSLLEDFKILVGQITEKRSVSENTVLRSTFGDVLDAFAAFANSTWTEEETATFESCQCVHHRGELGTMIRDNYRKLRGEEIVLMEELVRRIFVALGQAYRSVATALRDGTRIYELPGKKKWPSSPSQLLPRGTATAQFAFIRWAQITTLASPIRALCLLSYCDSNLASEMSKNEALIPPVIDMFCKHIDKLQGLDAGRRLAEAQMGLIDVGISEYFYVFMNGWFDDQVYTQHFVENNTPTLVSFYKGLCVLITVLTQLNLSAPIEENIIAEISMTACNLYKSLSSTSNPVALHYSYVDFLEKFSNAVDTQIGALMTGIRNLRHGSVCAEPSCDLTPAAMGVKFKTCSRCQTTTYCSKECQTLDWKTHKGVCRSLKVLFSISSNYHSTCAFAALTLPTQGMMKTFTRQIQLAGLGEEDVTRATKYLIEHSNCIEDIQSFISRYNVGAEVTSPKGNPAKANQ